MKFIRRKNKLIWVRNNVSTSETHLGASCTCVRPRPPRTGTRVSGLWRGEERKREEEKRGREEERKRTRGEEEKLIEPQQVGASAQFISFIQILHRKVVLDPEKEVDLLWSSRVWVWTLSAVLRWMCDAADRGSVSRYVMLVSETHLFTWIA